MGGEHAGAWGKRDGREARPLPVTFGLVTGGRVLNHYISKPHQVADSQTEMSLDGKSFYSCKNKTQSGENFGQS